MARCAFVFPQFRMPPALWKRQEEPAPTGTSSSPRDCFCASGLPRQQLLVQLGDGVAHLVALTCTRRGLKLHRGEIPTKAQDLELEMTLRDGTDDLILARPIG
eukprot:CAMPEP_0181207962 /NCGR_PEP_ID=MMETSP1096-20121128/21869_1 /TAXON_ID=156174 ORGANISM="Chrysochromulina ericina, Strain CCMP281" /NCGR_SAMPLE_ID=MMETSP1096 /ASSEMBLY_ACC=CAM_ASM_000453 /LENGTH=102 /DNA_ID=CAMNT_0023299005 /DNA_START=343 /DNA_END=652 /DNA_ORIENTATION=-